jgi:hypothetical protein
MCVDAAVYWDDIRLVFHDLRKPARFNRRDLWLLIVVILPTI